ncbi:MAG: PRC-barrel domain-containing protein [Lautropia sp.]
MLRSIQDLKGHSIDATDGEIGRIEELYFDDDAWTVRYVVVETGSWLFGRKVLLSPYSFRTPLAATGPLAVTLSREQIKGSPDIATHRPISRQHESALMSYYGYPVYWGMGGVWGAAAYPNVPFVSELRDEVRNSQVTSAQADARAAEQADSHLRSSAEVTGYSIDAKDGSIGHVEDFLFGDDAWTIHYLVIDTRNWWPGGRKVLVATRWLDAIDWNARTVSVALDREQVRESPEYRESAAVDRDHETRLHQTHGRIGYWV